MGGAATAAGEEVQPGSASEGCGRVSSHPLGPWPPICLPLSQDHGEGPGTPELSRACHQQGHLCSGRGSVRGSRRAEGTPVGDRPRRASPASASRPLMPGRSLASPGQAPHLLSGKDQGAHSSQGPLLPARLGEAQGCYEGTVSSCRELPALESAGGVVKTVLSLACVTH